MKNYQLIICLLFATFTSACATGNPPKMKPQPTPTQANCPVIDSSDWVAWLNKMPGPNGPSLHIAGKIVVPTPGYTVTVKKGPLDRRQPPAQRLKLELTPPTGMVAQVITTQEIKAAFPTNLSAYRAVIIGCGDKVLATIDKVESVY